MRNRHVFLILVSASIFFSVSCSRQEQVENVRSSERAPIARKRFEVVLISGFESDPTAEQIAGTAFRGTGNSGIFQLMSDLVSKEIQCHFFNWNGADAGDIDNPSPGGSERIVKSMIEMNRSAAEIRFVFVAHSWGAHTVLEVAKSLEQSPEIQIDSVFVVDPSSLMRGKKIVELPANIPTLTNYYTGNMFCWGAWKDEPRVENIALSDPANGFSDRVNYGAAFDAAAHTRAEWDEKIHADICDRIGSIVESK